MRTMVKIDMSMFVQIANFIILIWAMNKVVYKPIRRMLAKRHEKISGLEDIIMSSEEDAASKDQALNAGIRQAREKGLREKEDLETQGRKAESELIEKINEKARIDLEQMRKKVVYEANEARQALQKEIDRFADDICRKILGRTVS
jgi:F-type H+-transporting ATPase subunit b